MKQSEVEASITLVGADLPKAPAETDTLGGALHYPVQTQGAPLPERFELVMPGQIEDLLEEGLSILGSNEEDIRKQLDERYPPPHPNTTFLHRYDGTLQIWRGAYKSGRRRRRRCWSTDEGLGDEQFDGWLLMERPIVKEVVDLPALQNITVELGAVLVSSALWDLHSKEELKQAGFTVVARRFHLLQVNYSPRVTRLYEYQEKMKQFKFRTGTGFPAAALITIFNTLRPNDQLSGVYSLVAVADATAGSVSKIARLLDLVRRIAPKESYWRKSSFSGTVGQRTNRHGWGNSRYSGGEYISMCFKDAVEACLPFLHAEEAEAREKETDSTSRIQTLRFCRFLRKEAKLAGLKIPPKPKPPKKPKPAKRKRRKRQRSVLALIVKEHKQHGQGQGKSVETGPGEGQAGG